ncbi:MAG: carboxypeptidase regulatory-like domain-containing protein [Spirochaetia bacterium]|nr:carboxypeptidase regulatory-like domain-containing protein [Spirochaetia bacterium]
MRKTALAVLTAVFLAVAALPLFAVPEGEDIAARHKVKLWTFESKSTEGWKGAGKYANACSVSTDTEGVTEGKYCMKVDLTGSKDWNQDLMVNAGPFTPEMTKLTEVTIDVNVPAATVAGLEYQEMYLVISSKANNFYQMKSPLLVGKQTVKFKVDPGKVSKSPGDIWQFYLVTNNSQPFKGAIYIDNISGKVLGEPGTAKGKVTDKDTGAGIPNARVVIGDKLVMTDSSGNFKMDVAEDVYKMAVVAFGYKDFSKEVTVRANQTNDMGNSAMFKKPVPKVKPVNITIDPSSVIREIDKHKMYGENIAAWHKVDGYRDAEALNKLKKIGATFYRIPGGDYGNLYDWKSGDVYRFDGTKNWTPELNYMGGMVPFFKRMEALMPGRIEVLPIINIMSPAKKTIGERIDYGIEWLQDMKDKGLRVRYVEIGNEMDNKPETPGPKKKEGVKFYDAPTDMKNIHWWTVIDNYSKVFNEAAYRIKKFDKSLKIMGPCPMQPMNQQRAAGEPWKAAGTDAPFWIERFLQKSAGYVDTIAVHEYPFWANNDSRQLLSKAQTTWPVYMPKYRNWIKKYVNSKYPNKYVEVALTEWNSGDENVMTAMIENALFCADYLGSFMNMGGDMAFVWDIYTQKPGLGGGHGLMDQENDPTSKFSERGHYWVFDMYYNAFGTKMVKCASDNPDLSVYAAMVNDNTISIMAINKTKLSISSAKIAVAGWNLSSNAKAWQLSDREYVWSKELYRPIVNSGPSVMEVNLKNGTYDFPPYSVTVLQVKK